MTAMEIAEFVSAFTIALTEIDRCLHTTCNQDIGSTPKGSRLICAT